VTHWADVIAEELLQRSPGPHLFATAITPSGPIHVGNMREVLTTEAVFRATRDMGVEAELIYIADDHDPLRKVYPFLHADYEAHVGKPLREIPCPDGGGRPRGCGHHDSYSAHFLGPFLKALEELGIRPRVLSAYDLYHEGRYQEHIIKALDETSKARAIIEEVSKRQLPKNWVPFNPQCPKCRRLSGVEVVAYSFPELTITCACGEETVLDIRKPGIGKLPWRVDWPARWAFLGVTFEAFGKDHGAAGGSWDTGIRLVREVFGASQPHHVMYEFLNLKGVGAMHSSTGLAVSAEEVLHAVPPEVLRYLLMRQSPRKHIELLNLADEFDRVERVRFGAEDNPGDLSEVERTYELSCPRGPPPRLPVQVNVRHLVTVVQMAPSVEEVERVLRRSGELTQELDEVGKRRLVRRVEHVRFWLQRFAPEQVRFEIQAELPQALELAAPELAFLGKLADALAGTKWQGQAVHDAIHDVAAAAGLVQGQAFRAVYRAILGQDRGPRAGFFLTSQDQDWVVARLRAASQSQD
jgi:lysyl-tRNA synthetase, class I